MGAASRCAGLEYKSRDTQSELLPDIEILGHAERAAVRHRNPAQSHRDRTTLKKKTKSRYTRIIPQLGGGGGSGEEGSAWGAFVPRKLILSLPRILVQ